MSGFTLTSKETKKKPRKLITSQRKTARKRHQIVEQAVNVLKAFAFKVYSFSEFKALTYPPESYVIRECPHASLYGTPGRKEGYIHYKGVGYIFEAKTQDTGGSVDEKIPYLVFAFLASPIPNWIVYFYGEYWSETLRGQAIVEWLRQEAKKQCPDGRHFYICCNDDEWMALAIRLFKQ